MANKCQGFGHKTNIHTKDCPSFKTKDGNEVVKGENSFEKP